VTTLKARRLDGFPNGSSASTGKACHQLSPDALSPADALANVLQEHERETKLQKRQANGKDAEGDVAKSLRPQGSASSSDHPRL
jgi:hypothetical protein